MICLPQTGERAGPDARQGTFLCLQRSLDPRPALRRGGRAVRQWKLSGARSRGASLEAQSSLGSARARALSSLGCRRGKIARWGRGCSVTGVRDADGRLHDGHREGSRLKERSASSVRHAGIGLRALLAGRAALGACHI